MRTQITCPKCKNTPTYLMEVWNNGTIIFDTDENGLWDGNDGIIEPPSTISHVEGFCSYCGHLWRLRGVTQIIDIKKAS